MKVSLVEELQTQAQKAKEVSTSDPVKAVQLLLEGDSQEDLRILQGLSDNSDISRIQKAAGNRISLEKLEKSYAGPVYTADQIKNLAVEYRLRFLKAALFTGSFDVEVAAKIKQFAKETNSPVDSYSLKNTYFILAPESMFTLQEEKYITKRQKRIMEDPLIFFKIDDTHYRLIHKWGNDFSIFRYLQGFEFKSIDNHFFFNIAKVFPVIVALFTYFVNFVYIEHHLILSFLAVSILSALGSYFGWCIWKTDDGVIDGFFSETNWNSDKLIKR